MSRYLWLVKTVEMFTDLDRLAGQARSLNQFYPMERGETGLTEAWTKLMVTAVANESLM